MREGLLLEVKEALRQEGVDVSDFGFVGKDGLTIAVVADSEVYVLEFDQYWEEAEIVQTYPAHMLYSKEGYNVE